VCLRLCLGVVGKGEWVVCLCLHLVGLEGGGGGEGRGVGVGDECAGLLVVWVEGCVGVECTRLLLVWIEGLLVWVHECALLLVWAERGGSD
jgi:hypothetical protein